MSIAQMNAVWEYSKQKGSKLLLLLAIADNADDEGYAWPGIKYLAKKVRMSKRHVSRMVAELADTNELAVAWERGRGKSHGFYILLNKTAGEAATIKTEVAALNEKRDNMSHFSDSVKHDNLSVKHDNLSVKHDNLSVKHDNLSVKHDIAMSPEPSEPIKEPSKNRQEPGGLSNFDWPAVLESLQLTMTKDTYQAHFPDTTARLDDGTAVIVTKNQYSADWINGRLKNKVEMAVKAVTGQELLVFARPALLKEQVND